VRDYRTNDEAIAGRTWHCGKQSQKCGFSLDGVRREADCGVSLQDTDMEEIIQRFRWGERVVTAKQVAGAAIS